MIRPDEVKEDEGPAAPPPPDIILKTLSVTKLYQLSRVASQRFLSLQQKKLNKDAMLGSIELP